MSTILPSLWAVDLIIYSREEQGPGRWLLRDQVSGIDEFGPSEPSNGTKFGRETIVVMEADSKN